MQHPVQHPRRTHKTRVPNPHPVTFARQKGKCPLHKSQEAQGQTKHSSRSGRTVPTNGRREPKGCLSLSTHPQTRLTHIYKTPLRYIPTPHVPITPPNAPPTHAQVVDGVCCAPCVRFVVGVRGLVWGWCGGCVSGCFVEWRAFLTHSHRSLADPRPVVSMVVPKGDDISEATKCHHSVTCRCSRVIWPCYLLWVQVRHVTEHTTTPPARAHLAAFLACDSHMPIGRLIMAKMAAVSKVVFSEVERGCALDRFDAKPLTCSCACPQHREPTPATKTFKPRPGSWVSVMYFRNSAGEWARGSGRSEV